MSNSDHLGTWIIFGAVGTLCAYYTIRGIRDAIRHEKARAAERRLVFAEAVEAINALAASLGVEYLTPDEIDRTVNEEARYIDTEWWLHNRRGNAS